MAFGPNGQILSVEPAEGEQGVLRVVGELDISTSSLLTGAVEHVAAPAGPLTLDLRDLEFIDAAGLRTLLELRTRLGDRLRFRSPSHMVQRLMSLTGVEETLLGAKADGPGRVDFVRRLWNAFVTGGPAAVAELVPEDVEWMPVVGNRRVLRTPEEFINFWASHSRRLYNPREFTDLGSDVLVRCELPLEEGGTREIWALYQFDGMRLLRAMSFEDRAEALTQAA